MCVQRRGTGRRRRLGRAQGVERASSTATASWAACALSMGTGSPFMSIEKLSVWPLAVVT